LSFSHEHPLRFGELLQVTVHQEVHRQVCVEFSSHTVSCRDARSKDFLADIGLAGILEAEVVNSALVASGIFKMSTRNQYFVVDERQSVFAGIFLLGRIINSADNFFSLF